MKRLKKNEVKSQSVERNEGNDTENVWYLGYIDTINSVRICSFREKKKKIRFTT